MKFITTGLLCLGLLSCALPAPIPSEPERVVGHSAAITLDLADQKRRGFEAQAAGDFQGAWNLLLPCAEAGDREAQYQMGWLSEEGWDAVPGDAARAADWYRRAAAQDYVRAQLWLGYHLAGRMSRAASLESSAAEMGEGIHWLMQAAGHNSIEAQMLLGDIYWNGSGYIAKDVERARLWYQKAADQGHPMAQIMLRLK